MFKREPFIAADRRDLPDCAARMREIHKAAFALAAVAIVLFTLLWLSQSLQGRFLWNQGQAAESEGQTESAIGLYFRAIRVATPVTLFGEKAGERLLGLADEFETQGRKEKALKIHRRLAAATRATRSLWDLGEVLRKRSESEIVRLQREIEKMGQESP